MSTIRHTEKGHSASRHEDPLVSRMRSKGLLVGKGRAVRGLAQADLPRANTKQGKRYYEELAQAAGRAFEAAGTSAAQEVIEARGKE